MAELVVIGGSDFVLGFYLTGIKRVYEVEEGHKIENQFKELVEDPTIGIIVTDDKTMSFISHDYRRRIETSVKPIVITLSKQLQAQDNLREMIKRSIGVDLLAK